MNGYYINEDGNYNSFDEKCFQRKAGEEILLKITNYYSNDEAKRIYIGNQRDQCRSSNSIK